MKIITKFRFEDPRTITFFKRRNLNLVEDTIKLIYYGTDYGYKFKDNLNRFFTAHYFKAQIGNHVLKWIVVIEPIYYCINSDQIIEEAIENFKKEFDFKGD